MRGRSSDSAHEAQLRAMLDAETYAGHVHLAGIALSRATNMSERTSRDLIRRVNHLRDMGVKDPGILVQLNAPRQAAS